MRLEKRSLGLVCWLGVRFAPHQHVINYPGLQIHDSYFPSQRTDQLHVNPMVAATEPQIFIKTEQHNTDLVLWHRR
jgi:hypothetical protein